MRYPSFIGGSYPAQSPTVDAERTINLYPEVVASKGANAQIALYSIPGSAVFVAVDTSGGKAMFESAGRCFGVVGNVFYEFFENQTAINRGTVAGDANPATISTNGDGGGQLFVTSGDKGYNYDLATDVLTEVISSGATMGAMLYGYFLCFNTANAQFRISDLFDGTTWDPTQFAGRTIGSDPWVSMGVSSYGHIWLLGEQTSEVWYNAGTFPFPFAPHPSGLVPVGIAAPFSLKEAGGSMVWLSRNRNGQGIVMRAEGFTPSRISTHASEYAFAQFSTLTNSIGETYEQVGHAFYLLSFPGQMTWTFDFATGLWHERGTWIAEQNTYTSWRPQFHCFAFNKHLMCDRETGDIHEVSSDYYTDVDSRPLRRVRQAPAIIDGLMRVFYSRFTLFVQVGVGTGGTGQGSTPQVVMQSSNDGGRTWGNERPRALGKIGQYGTRVYWTRCGSARQRVFRVIITDPVPVALLDAFLDVERSDEAA